MSILSDMIQIIPSIAGHQAPHDAVYQLLKKVARLEADRLWGPKAQSCNHEFGPFGKIKFPYHSMGGAVSSVNLFDLDELIIFSFYWANRRRYKKVADIGANLGLHSVILSRCGYKVRSYEPDPAHYQILLRNLKANRCANVTAYNSAVSSESGSKEFVRILGNTTGSHLAGSKSNLYGKIERFDVRTESIKGIMSWADLIKIDAEGHEKAILLATQASDWAKTDAMIEVQNLDNAKAIFKHFKKFKVNMFSQKTNWQKVSSLEDMPSGYKEGSLFISKTTRGVQLWN